MHVPINVQLFIASSGPAQHPSVDVTVPANFKIVGGGALDHWSGAGNLLTASFPSRPQTWSAAGKDHQDVSPASITAFALAIEDPNDEWDVVIKSETSDPIAHPQAVATLPHGYTLTGGGAFVDYGSGYGNLLTASFPTSQSSWEARSKDHLVSDPASITSYVIGMKHRSDNVKVEGVIRKFTSATAQHPTAQVCLEPGWTLSGGGALDEWQGEGNLLTASFPRGLCWFADGKDHIVASPAPLTAYVIGIRTA
jgi:hypothetical protein